jgi:hypothetical protein
MDFTREHFEFFCKAIGFDIEKYLSQAVKTRKINISLLDAESGLVDVYNLLSSGNEILALQALATAANGILEVLKKQDNTWLIENTALFQEALVRTSILNKESEKRFSDGVTSFLKDLATYPFFQEAELSGENITPELLISLEKTDFSGLLKRYVYKAGAPVPEMPGNVKFRISDKLYLVETLQEFFSYLRKNELDENIVHVHYLMKMEQRIDLCYFIISFSYKGNVWFVSDVSTDFDNPRNKATTRNPRRRREKFYDALAFPYQVIDQLEYIMKQERHPVQLGNKTLRIFQLSISELPVEQKVFFVSLVRKTIPTLHLFATPVKTLGEHFQQKLLNSGAPEFEINPDEVPGFESWDNPESRQIINELIESVDDITTEDTPSAALVKVSHSLLVKNEGFDADWLGTDAELENITRWIALDTKAKIYQKELDACEKYHDKDKDKYDALLHKPENLDRLWPFLLSGDEVYFDVLNGRISQLKFKEILKNRFYPEWYLGMPKSERERKANEYRDNDEISSKYSFEKYVWSPMCSCCKKVHASHLFDINIEHYTQLMFMAGVTDQSDLPRFYRHYRSHRFAPSYGNPILDNVHPFSMLRHPSWRRFTNGIFVKAYLCRRCEKSLRKKHFKAAKTLIMPDFSIREISEDEAMKLRRSFFFVF